ncbi:hypothetical protein EON64_02710 [archaeon]|nr:MAG: hypothetical protein EON64_02710 [archaeon]
MFRLYSSTNAAYYSSILRLIYSFFFPSNFRESMQLLDPTSSHVLQSMYKECMGVGVLMGYTISSTESHQKTDEEGASELGGAFQPFYLVDTDRLKVIHLDSLDKEATISLAREVASDISYEQIDDIFEQSNGRPLYIAELVKNQIAKPNEKTEMGEKVNNARIEEVVCYRIDQLQLPLQIILKACAVAASYSNSFTLSMLKFILANDAHFYQQTTQSEPPAMRLRRAISKAISISGIRSMAPPTCTVEQALAKLLQEEDFLTISGTQLEKKDIEADELHKYTLVFQVPLEQTIIYGLIVDEQKEFFHERVALRIHSSIISEQSEAVKQSSLWEVGFHWDAATLWSRALRSYVQAAKRCRIEGGSQLRITECLLMAYQTYQHLEQEVGILELPQSCHQHIDLLFTCLLAPSHEAFIQLEGQFELLLAIKPAIDIFEHDTEALSFAVLLHIMLVDAYLQQWEDIAEVTRVLMVGIILAVAEQYRKYLQQTRMSEDHVERESQKRFLLVSVVEDEYVPPKRTLVYTDFVRMLTQTQFCMQYCSDMSYLVSKTVLSFLEGRDAQPEAWFPLQCQLLQALRHVQTGNMLDAQLVIDSVVYDPAVHSSTLASMYSVDLMPYLLALLGRGLILLNGSASGTGYLTRCFSYLDGVSHGLSRTIAAVVCASIEDYLSTGSVFSLDQTLSNDWNASVVRIIRAWYNVRQSSDSRPCTPLTMEQYGEMFKAADRLSADRTTVCMLTFMEINGLVVDRMLFDIAASLFNSRSREQRLLLDQHLLAWLKALLLSPAHNYMTMVAKGCNLLAT